MTTPPATTLESRTGNKSIATGIACGAGAGALWGLVFLAPELVRDFTPTQLAIARYFFYGVISLWLIAPRWRGLSRILTRRDWLNLIWLSLAGNTVYYILLSTAVQNGGVAMTSLIMGFLPVIVTIIGSRERNAVPLGRLVPSLALCVAGALCIGWQSLAVKGTDGFATQAIGFACAVGALLSWTAYAVGNARALMRLERVSAHNWSLLTGIVTGAQSMLLIPITLIFENLDYSAGQWAWFGSVSLGIAVLASIGGNALWNRMSQLLPLTLVGQMILFETLFALLYGFLWEMRFPTLLETLAFALVVASVLTCLAAHRRPAAAAGQ